MPGFFLNHGGQDICQRRVTAVFEFFQLIAADAIDEATLRRYLAVPIAIRDRLDKDEKLRRILAQNDDKPLIN